MKYPTHVATQGQWWSICGWCTQARPSRRRHCCVGYAPPLCPNPRAQTHREHAFLADVAVVAPWWLHVLACTVATSGATPSHIQPCRHDQAPSTPRLVFNQAEHPRRTHVHPNVHVLQYFENSPPARGPCSPALASRSRAASSTDTAGGEPCTRATAPVQRHTRLAGAARQSHTTSGAADTCANGAYRLGPGMRHAPVP